MESPRPLTRTDQDVASAQATLRRSLRPTRVVLSLAFLVVVLSTPGEQVVELGAATSLFLAAVACANAAVNAAGMLGWAREIRHGRAFAVQMAADALLALAGILLLNAAATPLAWIALLLPVFDAAVAFGGRAAGLVWAALSLAYVAVTLQLNPDGASDADALALAVQQLAAAAVVALPAGYVAARLRDDLAHSHSARIDADERADELLVVAEAARRLAAATDSSDVLDITLHAAASLGFAGVDACERHDHRSWRLLHAAGPGRGPTPALDRSLDRAVAEGRPVTIAMEGRPGEEDELRLLGYRSGIVLPVSQVPGHAVALRAWSTESLVLDSSAVASVKLLATLTAAAWQNASTLSHLAAWSRTLEHQATHDELTGLANRAHLLANLERSLVRSESTGTKCAVLFLDLDGFKEVNDELGHAAGDAVLQGVAERLGRQVRGHDLLARLGGDEFVLVLEHCEGPEHGAAVATRLCEAVTAPFSIAQTTVTVGASIGIAYAERGDTAERLLTTADRVMYEAKRRGGNRFVASRVDPA